jgi:predicted TIM-barrel fold metal-dependent hydrolase
MAIDGVDAEVLYSGHFGGQATDAELRLALLQAYHDWKADFCRYAPDRFKATASLPMWDINLAIQEMERLDKTGVYAQTAISSYSPDPDKPYRLPYWDPMWSAFEEHNWLATIHVGGATRTTLDTDPLSFISCTPICAEPFAMLIFGGVLERHPKLRLISAETGFGWWPYFNDRMDTVYRRHRWWTKSTLPNLPSFYVKRQVWYTFEEDRAGMELLHHFGEDRVMWAADYPHTDTTWPDSQKFLDEHFRLVPEKDRERRRRLITCENAGRLYGWIK